MKGILPSLHRPRARIAAPFSSSCESTTCRGEASRRAPDSCTWTIARGNLDLFVLPHSKSVITFTVPISKGSHGHKAPGWRYRSQQTKTLLAARYLQFHPLHQGEGF